MDTHSRSVLAFSMFSLSAKILVSRARVLWSRTMSGFVVPKSRDIKPDLPAAARLRSDILETSKTQIISFLDVHVALFFVDKA